MAIYFWAVWPRRSDQVSTGPGHTGMKQHTAAGARGVKGKVVEDGPVEGKGEANRGIG